MVAVLSAIFHPDSSLFVRLAHATSLRVPIEGLVIIYRFSGPEKLIAFVSLSVVYASIIMSK